MRYSKILRAFCLLCLTATFASCQEKVEDVHYVPKTPVGQVLLETCPEVARIFRDTTFVVAVGVDQTFLHLQTSEGYVQQVHLLRIDTNTPGLKVRVAMPDNSNDISAGWKRQTLTDMATIMSKPRARVVGMINGDFWDMTEPINPRGPVHRGGAIVSSQWDYNEAVAQQALSFVAIKKDGSMIIDDSDKYESMKNDLVECTGAGFIMLREGAFPGTQWTARDPRSAIGYTKDGIVYMLTVDGRKTFGAAGMTYKEMAFIFQSLGCVSAANLDGGGSAQMLIRHPVAGVFQIRNSPADGQERPVVNAWTVIVDEE